MHTVPVHAYGIASTLKPKEVVELLPTSAERTVKVTKTHALVRYGQEKVIVVYDFGALVFFDSAAEERERTLERVLKKVGPEPHPPLLEDYLLEVRPGSAPEVTFDRAVVPDLENDVLELVSLVLAQSVAMDYYEEDVAEMIGSVDRLSTRLAGKGRLWLGRERTLLRFIGGTMLTRSQILTTLSLLDAPAITWENEVYDRLYRALRGTFEIEDRYRTLEDKLRMVQENLGIIVDLVQHRRATLLEIVVVVLILVEVMLAFYEHLGRKH